MQPLSAEVWELTPSTGAGVLIHRVCRQRCGSVAGACIDMPSSAGARACSTPRSDVSYGGKTVRRTWLDVSGELSRWRSCEPGFGSDRLVL